MLFHTFVKDASGLSKMRSSAGIICIYQKKRHETSSDEEGESLINTIKNGSVVTWQHINLQGEYDFSEENLKNPIEFQLPELLDLQEL